jgi:hypothetical protein
LFELPESALALDRAAAHDAAVFFDEDVHNCRHIRQIIRHGHLHRVGVAPLHRLHLKYLIIALDRHLQNVLLLQGVVQQNKHAVLALSNLLGGHREVRLLLADGSLLLPDARQDRHRLAQELLGEVLVLVLADAQSLPLEIRRENCNQIVTTLVPSSLAVSLLFLWRSVKSPSETPNSNANVLSASNNFPRVEHLSGFSAAKSRKPGQRTTSWSLTLVAFSATSLGSLESSRQSSRFMCWILRRQVLL